MFDIGFSELLLILVLGLIVLGPKRLPIAIRTVMSWVATVRGLADNVKNELNQELKIDELKQDIQKVNNINLEEFSPELAKNVQELQESAKQMHDEIRQQANDAGVSIQQQIQSIKSAAQNGSENQQTPETVSETTALNEELSPAEQAELAELEFDRQLEQKLAQYYPVDDEPENSPKA